LVVSLPVAREYPAPLLPGNSKLGSAVWHFSLPAIKTCVNHSGLCAKLCYATKGHYRYASVQQREAINEEMRKQPNWVARVVSQIALHDIRKVRIHTSGDFDSVEYAESWVKIAEKRTETRFWAYTRSWATPEILAVLDRFSRLPNVSLWHSCDKETGMPPRRKRCKRAYLAVSDTDLPTYKVDLIFRNYRFTKQVRMGGVMVCPAERQRATKRPDGSLPNKTTCAQCKICFVTDRLAWLDKFNAAGGT
jgi:hypothetical protein